MYIILSTLDLVILLSCFFIDCLCHTHSCPFVFVFFLNLIGVVMVLHDDVLCVSLDALC
jgi:hypothetical protein